MKQLEKPTDIEYAATWDMGCGCLLSKLPAIKGKAVIRHIDHWGDVGVITREVENPTYLDLYRIASELIVESGDTHHHFIEGIEYDADEDAWDLVVGS